MYKYAVASCFGLLSTSTLLFEVFWTLNVGRQNLEDLKRMVAGNRVQ